MASLEKCLNQVKRRRWEHIRAKWLHHIPHFSLAGEAPPSTTSDIVGFGLIANQLAADARIEIERLRSTNTPGTQAVPALTSRECELPGLREAVFWESLYLLHKSRHVLGAAELHVRDGIRTWAVADAYQGAFFGSRAVLGLLGLSFPEHNNKAIVIDLFPQPVRRADEYSQAAFHYYGSRLEHRPVWEFFLRILGVSTVDVWPRDIVNKLKSIESKNFSKQRNEIHYKNNGWILNDLHESDFSAEFGVLRSWATDSRDIDFERNDISLVVAFCVLKLGLLLLKDLEGLSAKLKGEFDLLTRCRDSGRHPLYGDLLLA